MIPGCVYWNNFKSIIKTMFYHFPSRLVTSYKLDHLTHLSCTWNSNWNSAILTVQRKITFQSPTYIFFWFILLIFYLDQNPNSLVFLQAHIWATSIIVLGNGFSFRHAVHSIYNLVNNITGPGIESLMGCQEHLSNMSSLRLTSCLVLQCSGKRVCARAHVCLHLHEFCVC